MKIELIKEYCACFRDENGSINTETFKRGDTVSTSMEMDRYFTEELARWLINNGFAEEVKESKWWKPKGGENYYFVDDAGYINSANWTNQLWEVDRFAVGSCFKTKDAAERYRDYLKAIATVRQDEGVLTPDQLQEKERDDKKVVFIGYDSMGRLATNPISLFSYDIVINAILFDNETHAQASLDNHPDEWRIITNYDWSRE